MNAGRAKGYLCWKTTPMLRRRMIGHIYPRPQQLSQCESKYTYTIAYATPDRYQFTTVMTVFHFYIYPFNDSRLTIPNTSSSNQYSCLSPPRHSDFHRTTSFTDEAIENVGYSKPPSESPVSELSNRPAASGTCATSCRRDAESV